MKRTKIFAVVGMILCFSILAITVNAEKEKPKQKINWVHGEVASISFEDMVKKADVIAEVKIIKLVEILKEQGMEGSKFLLKVKKYYKNNTENDDDIYVYQAGSPEWQFEQNPLLELGKSYVLFLDEVDSPYGKALIMIQEGYGRYNFVGDKQIQRQLPLLDKEKPLLFNEFEQQLKKELEIQSIYFISYPYRTG